MKLLPETRRLAKRVTPLGVDSATEAVILYAIQAAVEVTHEMGSPELTDRAILDTYRDAVAWMREGLVNERVDTL